MQILRYKIRCIKNSGLRQKAYFMFADQCMYTLRIILSVGLSVMLLNNFPSFYQRSFLCKDSLCIITLYTSLLCTLFAFICFAFYFFNSRASVVMDVVTIIYQLKVLFLTFFAILSIVL